LLKVVDLTDYIVSTRATAFSTGDRASRRHKSPANPWK